MSDAGSVAEAIRPRLREQLQAAVEGDPTIAAAVEAWAPPGLEGAEALLDAAAARQAAVLTAHGRYCEFVGERPPSTLRTTPVRPFQSLPTPVPVAERLDGAAPDSGDQDGAIAAGYEAALADGERRARGQFYTPAPVARAATRWALDGLGGTPRVLDPAAGTGAFPAAIEERARDVDTRPPSVVAVDVDDVALHLAQLRLSAAAGGGPVDWLDARVGSFFDREPADLGPIDAVVGNPPFVRAGDLVPDRAHFRAHLMSMAPPDAPGSYADGDRALSRRSDASVYFVTHATRFLRPGGRLALVLPAKWLESEYGVGFRRFLADHYRVHAVVGLGAGRFDALVDTVLLLAERRAIEAPRADRPVRFVRLDTPGATPTDLDAVLAADGAGVGGPRVVRRSHATFATAEQCSPYLRAPSALLPLLDHEAFVALGELAAVSRGVMTGANRFFLLDRDDVERWELDPAVRQPALRSVKGLATRTLTSDDVEQSIVAVHDVLADRVPDDPADPTAAAKRALEVAGHDGLLAYIDHAETQGFHEGRTCRARPVWFDLGPLPTPDAFVPKLLRERVFTIRNRAGAVPSNAIDCLAVRDGVDPALLLGVLDSSLVRALMEVWGRDEAGMLQLMTYETRTLPVPDVRTLDPEAAGRIRAAADRLDVDGADPEAQAALDRAVLDAFALPLDAGEVDGLRRQLLRRRVDGTGVAPAVGD